MGTGGRLMMATQATDQKFVTVLEGCPSSSSVVVSSATSMPLWTYFVRRAWCPVESVIKQNAVMSVIDCVHMLHCCMARCTQVHNVHYSISQHFRLSVTAMISDVIEIKLVSAMNATCGPPTLSQKSSGAPPQQKCLCLSQ